MSQAAVMQPLSSVEGPKEPLKKTRSLPLRPVNVEAHINWRSFSYYPALARVKSFVEENYHQPLRLATSAQVAGMEATYFSAFFHQKVGVKYIDWIRYVRTTRAMELIQSENRPITEVAYAVGFSDLRTFERAFKKITDLTPREFKKLARPA
jgi:two-component system, response regulator YesN